MANLTEFKTRADISKMSFLEIRDILKRLNNFHEDSVAICIFEIHSRKLYKEEYSTFEEYCETECGFSRQRGYQLIEHAKKLRECKPLVDISGERKTRALSGVPPEKRPEVLKKAQESGKLTAESIKKAADDVLGNNTQKPISERPKTREEQLREAWLEDKWSNVDSTGFPVPPESQDIWDRRDEPKWMLKAISDVRCALEKINEKGDPLYRELNYSKLKVELDAIRYDLKTAIPYAVCPKCQGCVPEDCDLCKARGFVSKFRYDRVVPIELKALRDKVIQTKSL